MIILGTEDCANTGKIDIKRQTHCLPSRSYQSPRSRRHCPTLQTQQLRPREGKSIIQGHTADKWQSQNSSHESLSPRPATAPHCPSPVPINYGPAGPQVPVFSRALPEQKQCFLLKDSHPSSPAISQLIMGWSLHLSESQFPEL